MLIITVALESELSVDLEMLRRSAFPGTLPSISSEDEFDVSSSHLVARLDGKPIGMIRLTMRPPSILDTWSRGNAPINQNGDVAELSRSVTSESMRGLRLYKLLMSEIMLRAMKFNATFAAAVVELDFPPRPFLKAIGFCDVGKPVECDNPPSEPRLGQMILCQLKPHVEIWKAVRVAQIDSLNKNGYEVKSVVD